MPYWRRIDLHLVSVIGRVWGSRHDSGRFFTAAHHARNTKPRQGNPHSIVAASKASSPTPLNHHSIHLSRQMYQGRVRTSNTVKYASASSRLAPHISFVGRRLEHTSGRSARPKIAQRISGKSCTQGIPAGLPCGMPGIGELMLGATQHAPQCDRHSIVP